MPQPVMSDEERARRLHYHVYVQGVRELSGYRSEERAKHEMRSRKRRRRRLERENPEDVSYSFCYNRHCPRRD